MAAKKEQLYIWSLRFSPARGWHVEKERTADNEREAQLWLDVFRNDEPRIDFIASVKPPKIDMENLTFAKATTARKANPAPRKRAAKKSAPKSFDQFTKRQLQDFITGCHNARDYGPEFTAACYALNSQTTAPRKTNPAKRPAPKKRAISRPSQVTKKVPSKRLVARRKVAAKKPVKGYFPNPVKDRTIFVLKVTLSDSVMKSVKAPESARIFIQIYYTEKAAIKNAHANSTLGVVSLTKMKESEMRDAAFMQLIGN